MRGNHTAKKVLGFLFFRSAFTQRNITSIGLVVLFFVIYVLAGGKIDAIPKIKTDPGSFGGVDSSSQDQAKQLQGKQKTSNSQNPLLTHSRSQDGETDPAANRTSASRLTGTRSGDTPTEKRDSTKETDLEGVREQTSDEDPFQSIEKKLQERKKR